MSDSGKCDILEILRRLEEPTNRNKDTSNQTITELESEICWIPHQTPKPRCIRKIKRDSKMPVKMYKKFPTQPEDPRSAEYDFCLISHDIAFPKILLCSEPS